MELQCPLDGEIFESYRGLANHIRKHHMTSKQFYDKFWKKDGEGVCQKNDCQKNTRFKNLSSGYNPYCSSACGCSTPEHRRAVSERFLGNPKKREKWVQNKKAQWERKSEKEKEEIYSRVVSTKYRRYGKNYFSEKTKKQWEAYTPEKINRIVKKSWDKKTNSFSYKPMMWQDEEIRVQGYEPSVLKLLKEMGFNEKDVLVGKFNTLSIFYQNSCSSKRHRYFPDILIPKFNLIIEVKSLYGYNQHKVVIHDKINACEKLGYRCVLAIFRRDPKWAFRKSFSKSREDSKEDVIRFQDLVDWAISSQVSDKEKGSTTSFMRRIQEDSKSGGLISSKSDMI